MTPAVTVTTAVEGLRSIPVVDKMLGAGQGKVIIITLLIISALFSIQHAGTSRIGKAFGPVMLVWFSFLGVTGLLHIFENPIVVKAFNPLYAVRVLFSPANKRGFMILGSVFLAATGAEALYSDMGHVGREHIYRSWPFVKICLILNYLGQGAWVLLNQRNGALAAIEDMNPFFLMLPEALRPFAVLLGALAAYPELGCTGGPYEVWTKWGISDQVLCPGKETMFTFLEDVFTELLEIFPSEYIHIGGDECPKTEWEKCSDCQARIKALGIKADEKHTAEQYLQSYVTARVQKMLNDKGRKIIGWDEILEGELAPGATVMSWRGVKGGVQASGMGFDVIMTPNTYCYFDYYQSEDKEKEPLAIGGNLPIEKVYGYEPFDGLDVSQQKHILGVQANLWTEYIGTPEYLEYMLLPRMAALSEIQWCKPSDKDFDRFASSMKAESFKIYDILGYNYRKF